MFDEAGILNKNKFSYQIILAGCFEAYLQIEAKLFLEFCLLRLKLGQFEITLCRLDNDFLN